MTPVELTIWEKSHRVDTLRIGLTFGDDHISVSFRFEIETLVTTIQIDTTFEVLQVIYSELCSLGRGNAPGIAEQSAEFGDVEERAKIVFQVTETSLVVHSIYRFEASTGATRASSEILLEVERNELERMVNFLSAEAGVT